MAIRLIANIVAGHLLLRLIGGASLRGASFLPVVGSQTLLFVLELAVAGIQAYVFIVLVVLYAREASCFTLGHLLGY